MNGHLDAEPILAAYLAPEADRLADRVLDAALDDIARTRQRRAVRVPWRFPTMPAISRATGIAAVALVAVVGAGSLLYLNSRAPGTAGGPGGQATASPAPPSAAPTTGPTAEPTPGCAEVAPGICGWKTYTSPVYGYTISYPDDWSVADRATQRWEPGEPEDAPSTDVFFNNAPEGVRDNSMVFVAVQFPAPAGADLGSWEGLEAALMEMCARPAEFFYGTYGTCPSEAVTRMCLGSPGCQPVALVPDTTLQHAFFGDPETGIVTYLHVGRADDFPAAARYGGTVMLLKSILSQLGVREPRPGEISK
ncbi:MAG TPA: hypothetical protein VFP56_01795 [Candidatus Limnocylindrales bacterium]|nr:hypothetical protein [Candidatus Limnocylindrales bacterium]